MNKKQSIIEALGTLDPNLPAQWTSDGLPTVESVRWLAKDQTISRSDITEAAPGFCKDNTTLPGADMAASQPQATPVVQAPATPVPVTAPVAPVSEPVLAAPQETRNPLSKMVDDNIDENFDNETEEGEEAFETETLVLKEAKDRFAAAKDLLQEAKTACDEANAAFAAAQAAHDAALGEVEALTPTTSQADAIALYHRRQLEIRNKRAKRIKEMSGISLKDILPSVAPIDAARRRTTGHGNKRG